MAEFSFKLSFLTISYPIIVIALQGISETALANIPFVKARAPSFLSRSCRVLKIDFLPST